jgi:hypothetical protein
MAMLTRILIIPAALLGTSAASAQPSQSQTAIDHAVNGGIRDWHSDDGAGLYIRDRTNRWYYAQFRHRCPGVLQDMSVVFDTNGSHRFDRLSTVRTSTMTCAVESLYRTEAPPAKGGKASAGR